MSFGGDLPYKSKCS